MNDSAIHLTTLLMAFFAIMNPIANITVFIGLTDGLDARTRRRVALQAVALAFLIVAAFTISGREIFSVFGITLPAFRIAGGAIVALVGYHMLQGQQSALHAPSDDDTASSRESALNVAITPLALPILAGPGTIATAMSFAAESTVPEVVRILVAFGVVCAVTLAAFLSGESLARFLGQNAITVITRLMGLILAVVGVQMLIVGIRGAAAAAPTG